ncbi:YrhB domain-containing protein [Streptomyces sp. SAI-126]|uniref:YrhB domain-containing protein n=1 Tax=Streptomyces sp. SAI-126 TaxID=3377732 RepID=UPI003C7CE780
MPLARSRACQGPGVAGEFAAGRVCLPPLPRPPHCHSTHPPPPAAPRPPLEAAEEQPELDHQQLRALDADAVRMAVGSVEKHELVWIVYRQSETFLRTRNHGDMLVGNGPYLVDGVEPAPATSGRQER